MFLRGRGSKSVALRRAEFLLLGALALHCGSKKSQYDDDDDSSGGAKSETGGSSGTAGKGGKGGSGGTAMDPGTPDDVGGAAGQAPGTSGDAGAENGAGDAGGSGPSAATGGGGSGGTSAANAGKGGSNGGKGGTSAGTAGAGGKGGTGGSAGATVEPFADCTLAPVAPAPTLALLDDFEDGDTYAQGYGAWYPFDDGSADPGDEATLATSTSTRASDDIDALEFTTGVHTGYGSGFGVILHDDAGTQTPEDVATSYDGFEFWARAASPGSVRVNFPDVNADPLGGVCATDDCFHYYGVDLDLDTTWRLYRVQWDEVYAASDVEPFDPHSVYRVEFAVDPAATLDMSIDDASFFRYATNAYNVSGRQFRKQHAQRIFHGVDRPSLEWQPNGDHLSRADLELMAGWGADTVRIALNQDFWLPGSPAYDASYAPLVDKMVACAHTADLDVILDLHWSDMGDYSATPGQQQMADTHSVAFWQDVATRYKNNSRVLFELYNEPHDVSWPVWRDGGAATGFTAVGFQDLYDAVRGTGAENVVLAGGLSYAFDLSGVPAYKIRGYNVGYVTHPYNFAGKQPADWPDSFGTVATEFPVIATEFGDTTSCSASYSQSFIDYAASLDISWTAWAWFVADTNPCAFPTIISDWDGTPTTAGAAVKAALQ